MKVWGNIIQSSDNYKGGKVWEAESISGLNRNKYIFAVYCSFLFRIKMCTSAQMTELQKDMFLDSKATVWTLVFREHMVWFLGSWLLNDFSSSNVLVFLDFKEKSKTFLHIANSVELSWTSYVCYRWIAMIQTKIGFEKGRWEFNQDCWGTQVTSQCEKCYVQGSSLCLLRNSWESRGLVILS